jgi:hypothetical protein
MTIKADESAKVESQLIKVHERQLAMMEVYGNQYK